MNTSISDVNNFLRCRRSWDAQSPNRQSLRRIGMIAPALHVGTGVHLGLAEMAKGEDWTEPVLAWGATALAEYRESYRMRVGAAPSQDEEQPYLDAYNLVVALLARYEQRYAPTLFGDPALVVRYVEQAFTVPIPGTDHNLVGTWDAILEHTGTGEFWIVENKTYSKRPQVADLLLTPQFSAYVWAAQQVFPGKTVAGVLYNGLAKKIPTGPDLLKSGGLSKAFNETVDEPTYLAAIAHYGLDPSPYADILARLHERDAGTDNPYWSRHILKLTPAQVGQTGQDIARVVVEMASDPAIYPTFRMEGCFDCQVRDLCQTIQHGEDTHWLIANAYTRHEGSASFRQGRVEVEYADAA